MLVILTVVGLFLYLIHILFNYNRKARLLRLIPGAKYKFIIGNALDCLGSPEQVFYIMREYYKSWKPLNRFWAFPIAFVNVYEPDDIEIVVSSTKHNAKSPPYYFLKNWLRDGLLLSKGFKWQSRRKILTPAFHFNILRNFCWILEDNSHRLVQTVGKSLGEPVDIIPTISEYTLYSICETAMGSRLSEENKESQKTYKQAICALGNQFIYRISRVYLHSDFIYNLLTLGKIKKELDIVHKFTKKVIQDRKDYIEEFGINIIEDSQDNDNIDNINVYKKNKNIAMLDLLITAQKKGFIDDIGIQEEVDTFMFEGHDTIAVALTYTLMLLANHRSIQHKVIAEIDDIFGDSTRPANIDDMSKMRYLDRCIKESLRLYPPVPAIGRILTEEVTLIPEGTYCHIQCLDLHRRDDLYKDPLLFDPDRFLAENCKERHPYAYIPFSAGPRNCIGQKFAILEMKSAISSLLRHYEFLPVTKPEDLKFIADLVLRTTNPVYVKFVKRKRTQ